MIPASLRPFQLYRCGWCEKQKKNELWFYFDICIGSTIQSDNRKLPFLVRTQESRRMSSFPCVCASVGISKGNIAYDGVINMKL